MRMSALALTSFSRRRKCRIVQERDGLVLCRLAGGALPGLGRIFRNSGGQHVRIDGVEEPRGQPGEIEAAGRLYYGRTIPVTDAPVKRGEPGGERREGIVVASPRRDLVEQPVE